MRSTLFALLAGVAVLGSGEAHKHRRAGRPQKPRLHAGAQARSSSLNNDVWPSPASMTMGNEWALLDPSFGIACAGSCPLPLPDAFKRYQNIMQFAGTPRVSSGANTISALKVIVQSDVPLSLGVNETYSLTIPTSGVATLTAQTQWGALRGLESFAQTVWWMGNDVSPGPVYNLTQLPISINDAPRFPWRGVLIDTSRHFLSVPTILSTLDSMASFKMNRLHWHIVDDNSWPLQSVSFPLFTKGAYERSAVYTHADVTTIVDYAWARGIQVIPEFDLPAHAQAWGTGYPNLIIDCPGDQPLADPTPQGAVYSTVTGLLKEFLPLFYTADFVHFGGDEVESLDCWANSPKVQAFMKTQGYQNVSQVRTYFQAQLVSIAQSFSVSPVFWEEVYDGNYLPLPANRGSNTTIDVWLSDDELLSVLKNGYRAIESFGLYLDQQDPAGGSHYFWVDTFVNFWSHDPLVGADLTPQQANNFLGMSQSQWGEQVNDASISVRMWPRTLGGAERMWSPGQSSYDPTDELFWRVDRAACHLLRRGIATSPIRPSDTTVYCALPTTTGGDYSFAPRRINWDENKEEL